MKFAFVVLHYMTYEDTVECIESIRLLEGEKDIVVVDNASPNDSGERLEKAYKDTKGVYVLLNQQNLGFAKGNNVGYRYAKEILGSDYIVLINNDTVIKQADFCHRIRKIDEGKQFHVLGPKIISMVDGMNQNPVPFALNSGYRIFRRTVKFILLYLTSFIGLDTSLSKNDKKQEYSMEEMGDYQLFGCCLIFSPEYIVRYDGIYDGTFMYAEEDILKWQCVKNNLTMIYDDSVEMFHKEGSSTNKTYGKSVGRRRFYYRNVLKSLVCVIKVFTGIDKV